MINKLILPLFFITISLLSAPSSLLAAECSTVPDHPLILAELIDIALENHPSTKKVWWYANRAASSLGCAESAYYPKIGIEANAKHGRDFKFVNGPDTNYTIVGADLVLAMLLYDFGERNANVNSAKMALLSANWQTDWNIQKVMVKVLENAYSTLHAQEVLQAAISSFDDAEKLLSVAKELNRAGLSPISDVYTGQATYAQMKMELSQQKALLDIHKGKLAASLGLPANVPLELAAIDTLESPPMQQTEALMALACQQRADLMAKQARLAESAYNQDRAHAAYGPKLSVYGRGGSNHYFHDKTNSSQYQISLNLEIPLFNGFETVYNNRIAYADAQISMEELADLQLDIFLEVLTYNRTLAAAQEMLPDADENLKNALKAYEGVLARYQAGAERIAEVSNAQRQLAAARVRYSDIKTRWLVSMANLAYATGTLAPSMETPCKKYR